MIEMVPDIWKKIERLRQKYSLSQKTLGGKGIYPPDLVLSAWSDMEAQESMVKADQYLLLYFLDRTKEAFSKGLNTNQQAIPFWVLYPHPMYYKFSTLTAGDRIYSWPCVSPVLLVGDCFSGIRKFLLTYILKILS